MSPLTRSAARRQTAETVSNSRLISQRNRDSPNNSNLLVTDEAKPIMTKGLRRSRVKRSVTPLADRTTRLRPKKRCKTEASEASEDLQIEDYSSTEITSSVATLSSNVGSSRSPPPSMTRSYLSTQADSEPKSAFLEDNQIWLAKLVQLESGVITTREEVREMGKRLSKCSADYEALHHRLFVDQQQRDVQNDEMRKDNMKLKNTVDTLPTALAEQISKGVDYQNALTCQIHVLESKIDKLQSDHKSLERTSCRSQHEIPDIVKVWVEQELGKFMTELRSKEVKTVSEQVNMFHDLPSKSSTQGLYNLYPGDRIPGGPTGDSKTIDQMTLSEADITLSDLAKKALQVPGEMYGGSQKSSSTAELFDPIKPKAHCLRNTRHNTRVTPSVFAETTAPPLYGFVNLGDYSIIDSPSYDHVPQDTALGKGLTCPNPFESSRSASKRTVAAKTHDANGTVQRTNSPDSADRRRPHKLRRSEKGNQTPHTFKSQFDTAQNSSSTAYDTGDRLQDLVASMFPGDRKYAGVDAGQSITAEATSDEEMDFSSPCE